MPCYFSFFSWHCSARLWKVSLCVAASKEELPSMSFHVLAAYPYVINLFGAAAELSCFFLISGSYERVDERLAAKRT